MNREEAIIDFKENKAKALSEIAIDEFTDIFVNNIEEIKGILMSGLKKLITKWNKERNEELVVVQYELLRTMILNESYIIYIHGYNSTWYLDDNSIVYELNLKFLFEPFIKLKEALIKEKKIYMGKINNYDIQEIIFEKVLEAFKGMSDIVRKFFWDLDEDKWINENLKTPFYVIKWNEYQSESEILFAMDHREKSNEDMLEILKKNKEKAPFTYSVWKNSKFNDLDLTDNPMLFINFKGSTFENVIFKECDILRAQLKGCTFINCDFSNTRLAGTSFENVIIDNCTFENSFMPNVNFKGANLRKVKFINADLRNVDFTEVEFSEVDFLNANVEESVFDLDKVPYLHLSSEQLQTIYIEGEG